MCARTERECSRIRNIDTHLYCSCEAQSYAPPKKGYIVLEAESGANADSAINGGDLPFTVDDAELLTVVPVEEEVWWNLTGQQMQVVMQAHVKVSYEAMSPTYYFIMVHYYNPDTAIDLPVVLTNERRTECISTTNTILYQHFFQSNTQGQTLSLSARMPRYSPDQQGQRQQCSAYWSTAAH